MENEDQQQIDSDATQTQSSNSNGNKIILLAAIGAIVVLVGAGAYLFLKPKSTTPATNNTLSMETETQPSTQEAMNETPSSLEEKDMASQSITLEEVALHATADDCWIAIEGNVYDVTPFIASENHPGGPAILQGCGKDATELYNDRPNGSGAHSEKARSFLPNYLIGTLAE